MLLINVEELVKKERLTYQDMHKAFAALYKLDYNPVAVKFFFNQQEYDNLEVEKVPGPKMTFCQVALASRMEDYIVKFNADKLMCGNAKISFGFNAPTDQDVDDHVKFVNDWDFAKECMLAKPRLPVGELKGIMTAPLYKTPVKPDVIFMVTDVFQAYHVLNDYIGATGVPTVESTHTINSAACGGAVRCYSKNSAGMSTMCAGSYTSGKTERGEVNLFIPGDHIEQLASHLLRRTNHYKNGSSFLGAGGQEYPGLDVCKQCPMVRFKDYAK
ncbi:DUF169 domain-containing protein [Peptococcaceae bacterium 1198_IL3148]